MVIWHFQQSGSQSHHIQSHHSLTDQPYSHLGTLVYHYELLLLLELIRRQWKGWRVRHSAKCRWMPVWPPSLFLHIAGWWLDLFPIWIGRQRLSQFSHFHRAIHLHWKLHLHKPVHWCGAAGKCCAHLNTILVYINMVCDTSMYASGFVCDRFKPCIVANGCLWPEPVFFLWR